MRTGFQWRDLPDDFGHWNTVYKRFNAWSAAGKLMTVFNRLVNDPDTEWLAPISRRIKTVQGLPQMKYKPLVKAARATSKIHLSVDAYGLPIAFRITGGEVHGSSEAQALIDELPTGGALMADKGYDSDSERIREQIDAKGMASVIPRKRN